MPLGRTNSTRMSKLNAKVSLIFGDPQKVRGTRENSRQKILGKADDHGPDHGARQAPDAADDGGGEGFDAWENAHYCRLVETPEVEAPHGASSDCQHRTEEERGRETRFTLTPIICAVSASWAEARIALPSRVRLTNSVRATTSTKVTNGMTKSNQLV